MLINSSKRILFNKVDFKYYLENYDNYTIILEQTMYYCDYKDNNKYDYFKKFDAEKHNIYYFISKKLYKRNIHINANIAKIMKRRGVYLFSVKIYNCEFVYKNKNYPYYFISINRHSKIKSKQGIINRINNTNNVLLNNMVNCIKYKNIYFKYYNEKILNLLYNHKLIKNGDYNDNENYNFYIYEGYSFRMKEGIDKFIAIVNNETYCNNISNNILYLKGYYRYIKFEIFKLLKTILELKYKNYKLKSLNNKLNNRYKKLKMKDYKIKNREEKHKNIITSIEDIKEELGSFIKYKSIKINNKQFRSILN